jgi:hypothetical protein
MIIIPTTSQQPLHQCACVPLVVGNGAYLLTRARLPPPVEALAITATAAGATTTAAAARSADADPISTAAVACCLVPYYSSCCCCSSCPLVGGCVRRWPPAALALAVLALARPYVGVLGGGGGAVASDARASSPISAPAAAPAAPSAPAPTPPHVAIPKVGGVVLVVLGATAIFGSLTGPFSSPSPSSSRPSAGVAVADGAAGPIRTPASDRRYGHRRCAADSVPKYERFLPAILQRAVWSARCNHLAKVPLDVLRLRRRSASAAAGAIAWWR